MGSHLSVDEEGVSGSNDLLVFFCRVLGDYKG